MNVIGSAVRTTLLFFFESISECKTCFDAFVESVGEMSENEVFNYLQRGGLLICKDFWITLGYQMGCILLELNSTKEYRMKLFGKKYKAQTILVDLTFGAMTKHGIQFGYQCSRCEQARDDMVAKFLGVLSNTLYNRFSHLETEIHEKKEIAKKLKAKNKRNSVIVNEENEEVSNQPSGRRHRKDRVFVQE